MRTLVCEFQPVFLSTGERRTGSPHQHYSYAYAGNKPVKRGDWALVHNGTNFGICEVKRVVPGIDTQVTKHVIEVLTKDEFEAYKEQNQKIEDLRQNLDELEYRLKEHKKMEKYRDLATEDPRAKVLLDQLESFFGINGDQLEAPPSTPAESEPA